MDTPTWAIPHWLRRVATSSTPHMSIATSGQRPTITLDRVPAGCGGRVVAVGSAHAVDLLHEGILPGTHLRLRTVAPVGGPVIVELGRATLAIARPIAATVRIMLETEGSP
jgi:Fe2+ transport system protein FeoA